MKKLAWLLPLIFSGQALANVPADSIDSQVNSPEIIGDFGGESVLKYYASITAVHSEDAPKHEYAVNIQPDTVVEKDFLPMVSHHWSVGKVEVQLHNLILENQGFFIVGDDELSVKWLQHYRGVLAEMNLVGIIVNAQNEQSLKRVRLSIPEVMMYPNPDFDGSLSQSLGVNHYPLLVLPNILGQDLEKLNIASKEMNANG